MAVAEQAVAEQARVKRSSQGPFTIWNGMTLKSLRRLFALRPPLHWTKLPRLLSLAGTGVFNSTMALAEQVTHGRAVRDVKIAHPPVFVLGFWRSGTTLLHNLLAMDPQFSYPTLYQTLFPDHFLLTQRVVGAITAPFVPRTRPMDNVATHWNVPQEDELALCNLSVLSSYLMLAFQHENAAYRRFLDFADAAPEEIREWKETFLYFLRKLTVHDPRPCVMKSPTHTYRVPLLLEMFPDARFVYIYRDPLAVVNSTLHLRKTLFAANALGVPCQSGFEEEILSLYERCFHRYEETKTLIPNGQLHEIRFEDLEADPVGQLASVYDSLRLDGFADLQRRVEAQLPVLQQHQKNRFPSDAAWARLVHERLSFAYDHYGYSPPFDEAVGDPDECEILAA